MSNRDDTIRDGRFLDTLDRKGDGHKFYSSFGYGRHYDRHCYHPYRRSATGYFSDEFRKAKPPTFDGELKKMKDEEAWLPGMKKLSKLHEYKENMKAIIFIFSLKGKAKIWLEDVKQVRDIRTKELSWHEFKRLLWKK